MRTSPSGYWRPTTTPDFRTVSDFRKDHLEALADLFLQVLALCQRAGLVKLGHVALDGAKVRANASRNKAMSYARMKEKKEQLAAEVAELLRRAQEVDDEEDRRYGQDKRGDELPEELAFRESRLRKIREAKEALEAEAREAAEQVESESRSHPWGSRGQGAARLHRPRLPHHAGPGGRDFQQAYNCQAVVDSAHQVIVAARATNRPSDKQQARAMVEDTIANVGAVPKEVPPTLATTRQKQSETSTLWGWTRSSHRTRPVHGRGGGAGSPRTHPQAPVRQGTGCGGSCGRNGGGSVTPRAWRRWSRCSARSRRGGDFRQFPLRTLERVNREWLLICAGHKPAEAVPLRGQAGW